MDIGEWIRTKREEVGKSRGNLAAWCDVDTSTINRIENGNSDPTFATVTLICSGLGVSMHELITTFRPNAETEVYSQLDTSERDYLSYSDLKTFEYMYKLAPIEACEILSHLMNQLISSVSEVEELQIDSSSKDRGQFTAENIYMLLRVAPRINLSISYPTLSPGTLLDIYKQQAVFTTNDLAAYVLGLSAEKSVELRQYIPSTLMSNLGLGSLRNIKFKDLLLLDQLLGVGEILAMAWFTFNQGWSNSIIPLRGESEGVIADDTSVSYLLFRLCRQLQHLNSLDEDSNASPSFIKELRTHLDRFIEPRSATTSRLAT